ncbi:MAG: glycosyltransferase family 39 protein, partial [Mycobacterium sp.]|nr:glycosyltransferase family 39 protein [Mycobacterium sp.]
MLVARETLLTERELRRDEQQPSPVAWRGLTLLCAVFVALLLAVSGRYGYHRDELYFIVIGGHPAFGYVDQPPLIPLLAHWLDAVSGHSLVALRVPSALAGALVVLLTGLLAHEFGGGRGVQLLAAGAMAASPVLLGSSHLMSTTSFDLLTWTLVVWLTVRQLRDPGPGWLLVGVAAGVGLEIKTLPLFLLVALLLGVIIVGPRPVLASPWLWAGALIAAALWAPNLAWQATHDWPQLRLASSIAAGHSGSSQPRGLFIPFQILLFNPVLAPVWLVGLWRLARDPELARWRSLPVAYLLLTGFFIAVGGKPYYLAGMYPVLFAAGAAPTLRWARADRSRSVVLAGAGGLSAVVSTLAALPIVPAGLLHDTPIVAMNYDAGEQVGWPQLVRT